MERIPGRMALTTAIVGSLLAIAEVACATILVAESFSHPNGNLVGQLPTPGPGGIWEAHLDAGETPIQVINGAAVLSQGKGSGGREDANAAFARQPANGTTFMRFDFLLPAESNGDIVNIDPDGSNFVHLKSNNLTNHFRARTGVVPPVSDGDFGLAINANGSRLSDGTRWPTDLMFDTWYRVVACWNAGTGESLLWLDPVDESSTHISNVGHSTGQRIESIALRQSSDYNGTQLIDNLLVATSFSEALGPSPNVVRLPGDFNGDLIVDAADYTVWRNHLGDTDETGINNSGDGGNVGPNDFEVWKSHYGMVGTSGSDSISQTSLAVPEPTVFVLIFFSAMGLGFVR